jgi:hypothetical protein
MIQNNKCYAQTSNLMLKIKDIILNSNGVLLTVLRILLFSSVTFKVFLLITFWSNIMHNFSKIKSSKEVRKQQESYYFCLMIEGSWSGSIPRTTGSGSRRPKNIQIRIRKAAFLKSIVRLETLLRRQLAQQSLRAKSFAIFFLYSEIKDTYHKELDRN